ncbi:decaprenyl-phosphate phosphoribosyltransferase [Cohnella sp. GCM10027633]|uniref:decaprenyl-phosphate phosphoribosyltransferase n=1 Tax=unclassified Cohnella TaxID=2636738 RepID=UPI00362A05E4
MKSKSYSGALPLHFLVELFVLMRPKQWTKNLLLFAAVIFSIRSVDSLMFLQTLGAFILFCLVSGCVYILNDYMDREADRNHPEKRFRPLASGAVNANAALAAGTVIALSSFISSFYLDKEFAIVLSLYFLLNIAYSFKLKHVVIFDIMCIAVGFVLRAIGGGLLIDVKLTPWFLLCILLLSLFLAISKRRYELVMLQGDKGSHRKVLEHYSADLLNQMNSIVTAATIVCYSLFTFSSGHSEYLTLTIPIVLYGIFRYLYLIHMHQAGGKPEKILLEDKHILASVSLYAVIVTIILFYYG